MTIPATYLLSAPSDADSYFGTGISSRKIVDTLKKINPLVWLESDYGSYYPSGVWYPGQYAGLTSIWVGVPGNKLHSKKITGIRTGVVPEFTQLDEKGFVMHLGWRRILEKVIKARAASRSVLEAAFGVTLDVVKSWDGWCKDCMRKNKKVRSTSKNNLCDMHSRIVANVENSKARSRDLKWLRRTERDARGDVHDRV